MAIIMASVTVYLHTALGSQSDLEYTDRLAVRDDALRWALALAGHLSICLLILVGLLLQRCIERRNQALPTRGAGDAVSRPNGVPTTDAGASTSIAARSSLFALFASDRSANSASPSETSSAEQSSMAARMSLRYRGRHMRL